jgi:hypothetical protein
MELLYPGGRIALGILENEMYPRIACGECGKVAEIRLFIGCKAESEWE